MKLDAEYWDQRYRQEETSWDLGSVAPAMRKYFNSMDKNAAVLIPGCGNAHEANLLLEKGFQNVTVLDISPTLTNQLADKWKGIKEVQVICEDFFEHIGSYDYIVEQTFFCALPPFRRKDYVVKMKSLLKPGGKLFGLMFDCDFAHDGPPFGGSGNEYELLFKKYFTHVRVEKSKDSAKPRLGREVFIEVFN
ncbi:MAG: methyltransferase domain-containing protein [Bacteroidetes bacterium]|nr:methyltransferase domain-containing protein [Bacteroidota bacterium]